jgi:DNA-binding XRE family transcriptional regulator
MNGKDLRRLRRQLGMTQMQLGDALDIHWNTIARAERDEIPVPRTTIYAARYLLLQKTKRRKN